MPTTYAFNLGVQWKLPWESVLDVSGQGADDAQRLARLEGPLVERLSLVTGQGESVHRSGRERLRGGQADSAVRLGGRVQAQRRLDGQVADQLLGGGAREAGQHEAAVEVDDPAGHLQGRQLRHRSPGGHEVGAHGTGRVRGSRIGRSAGGARAVRATRLRGA